MSGTGYLTYFFVFLAFSVPSASPWCILRATPPFQNPRLADSAIERSLSTQDAADRDVARRWAGKLDVAPRPAAFFSRY